VGEGLFLVNIQNLLKMYMKYITPASPLWASCPPVYITKKILLKLKKIFEILNLKILKKVLQVAACKPC